MALEILNDPVFWTVKGTPLKDKNFAEQGLERTKIHWIEA